MRLRLTRCGYRDAAKRALDLASEANVQRVTALALCVLGEIYIGQNRLDRAESMIMPAHDMARASGDALVCSTTCALLEVLYGRNGNASKLGTVLQQASQLHGDRTAAYCVSAMMPQHALMQVRLRAVRLAARSRRIAPCVMGSSLLLRRRRRYGCRSARPTGR